MIGAWAAADRLMMSKCKNMAMDKIRKLLRTGHVRDWQLEHISNLGYPLDSTLAQLLMDKIAYDCTTDQLEEGDSVNFEVAPHDLEMALALSKRINNTARAWSRSKLKGGQVPEDPASFTGCRYHDHTVGEVCHLTKKA